MYRSPSLFKRLNAVNTLLHLICVCTSVLMTCDVGDILGLMCLTISSLFIESEMSDFNIFIQVSVKVQLRVVSIL